MKNKQLYTIKDIEHITGIKAHTIRIWEQRYQILIPERTDTNIRYYNDDDLVYIMNVAYLNNNGVKISKIAQFDKHALMQQVAEKSLQTKELNQILDSLKLATIKLDETLFDSIIDHHIRSKGFEQTMITIIYPFLENLGFLWLTGSIKPVHEHFMSNLIRSRVVLAIHELKQKPKKIRPNFILFNAEKELHEISLLFFHYLLSTRGLSVLYLGSNLPKKDAINIVEKYQPDYLVSIFTSFPPAKDVETYVESFTSKFPELQYIISGNQTKGWSGKSLKNVLKFDKIEDLLNFLNALV